VKLQQFLWVLVLSVAAGCSSEKKWELADALPNRAPPTCVSADSRERSILNAAVTAIEASGEHLPNALDIGAQRLLSGHLFRTTVDGKRSEAVCVPAEILKKAAAALAARETWGKFRMVEYNLTLASRLPTRNARIVEAVGSQAFSAQVLPSDLFERRDIRPYARTVLASFGAESMKYRDAAYQQMSADTSMGTGAAQVAAAAGHPEALPRIERMMTDALASVSSGKAIPYDLRNRLYELAWAVAYSGEAGRAYAKPVHAVMQREVASWAPPFGMIELRPKRLCEVLALIEGSAALSNYPYCLDEKVPFEQ
jgi:hypothetical protein